MNQDMKSKVRHFLIRHIGYKIQPDHDLNNHVIIGIGRNLTSRGVLPTEIDIMFNNDVEHHFNFLNNKYDWFSNLSEQRQIALINLCFLGYKFFSDNPKIVEALQHEAYDYAGNCIMHSASDPKIEPMLQDIGLIIIGES
jgi:hypothetical protein